MNVFGASAPSYLKNTSPTEGLLSDAELAQLNSKSMRQGLLTTALTYLAQPKNQRYGSALPYLAKAGIAGTGAAQNVYDQATQDYINASKLQEIKQKKDADKAWSLIQNQIYTKTPDVTKQVTTAGGYAPSMDQVAPEQATPIPSLLTSAPTQLVQPSMQQSNLLSEQPMDANAPVNAPTISTAPNFNMVQQPDVTTTQIVQAGKPTLNSDLIQQFVTNYPSDERAQKLLANMEALKKLNTAEKGSHVLSDVEMQANRLTIDGTTTGKPLPMRYQMDNTGKIDLLNTKEEVPDIVSLQNERDRLDTQNVNGKNDKRIKEIQGDIDKKTGADQDLATPLSQDAIDIMAQKYLDGVAVDTLGMGKNATNARVQIYNRMAELGKDQGLTTKEIANQIATAKQDFATSSQALKNFSTGVNGNLVRSLNVTVSHLDTLSKLVTALQNKDVRLVNTLRQTFKKEFGYEAPTNFESARIIVGDEIVKSIVVRGGTGQERDDMIKTLALNNSPDQLNGTISTYKELLGGQLGGLRKQYKESTKRDDFNRFLFPNTIASLPEPEINKNQPIISSDAQKKADAILERTK
jgi:hypothetical protein